ncbi:MAG: class I SAM-dependent methyltransferase [Campylobacteraceae bacterium]|jgi:O-methyltransferase involved in polyketide biosynthesis|nr:class I SAM-dependent methyltransferase [Campylobacteraceae bacterium]
MVKAFIKKSTKSNIVYLGAGFDITYYRLNEQAATFYEIDLPEVIDARGKLLGEQPNELLIVGDIFDMKWTKQIDRSTLTLLTAAGVLQYFKEDKVIRFISEIKRNFPSVELIFDATNKVGLKHANRCVKTSENADAPIDFYIDDSMEFSKKPKQS